MVWWPLACPENINQSPATAITKEQTNNLLHNFLLYSWKTQQYSLYNINSCYSTTTTITHQPTTIYNYYCHFLTTNIRLLSSSSSSSSSLFSSSFTCLKVFKLKENPACWIYRYRQWALWHLVQPCILLYLQNHKLMADSLG